MYGFSRRNLRRDAAESAGGIVCAVPPILRADADEGQFPHVHAGYGGCNIQGCHCSGFKANGEFCENCGHPFNDHYEGY